MAPARVYRVCDGPERWEPDPTALVGEVPASPVPDAPVDLDGCGGLIKSVHQMPKRGDFDVEHDNDAELILADMEFSDEDHESERALKLKIIEIYNSKLDERERRKKFVGLQAKFV